MERFTISLDDKLAQDFDAWIAQRAYSNRSEAVRDLLRAELGRSLLAQDRSVWCVACLSYVYNHHERELSERLAAIQHAHHDLTVSSMHVHLDHDHCLETVILRGPSADVQQLADAISAERGVHHGKLNLIGVETHEAHSHAPAAAAKTKGARAPATHVHIKPAR